MLELFNDEDEGTTPQGDELELALKQAIRDVCRNAFVRKARLRDVAAVAVGAVNACWGEFVVEERKKSWRP